MRYSDFTDALLRALYFASAESGTNPIKFDKLVEHYGIEYRPGWLFDAQQEFMASGLLTGPNNSRNDQQAIGRLTGAGKRHVEELLDKRAANSNGIYISTVNPPVTERPSSLEIGDEIKAEIVPASNRMVRINHNEAEYREIAEGIDSLIEQVRQDNEVGETAEERDRILRSLGAARELWTATELRLIQIKVGVVMAVEDAVAALTKLGKAVGKAMLVDLILGFVNKQIGIDN